MAVELHDSKWPHYKWLCASPPAFRASSLSWHPREGGRRTAQRAGQRGRLPACPGRGLTVAGLAAG